MFFNKIQIVTLCLVLLGLNRVPNTLVIKLVHMTADGVAACAHGMHSAADSVSDSVAAAKAQDRAASAQETAKDVSAALALIVIRVFGGVCLAAFSSRFVNTCSISAPST